MKRNRRWVGALVVGAACAIAASCGGESANSARDASTDSPHADASQDAPHADAGPDAPLADASQDAPSADAASDAYAEACTNPWDFDASLCCYATVAEACKHRQDCIPKWPGGAFCPTLGSFYMQDCGGYHVLRSSYTEGGTNFYYNMQTGNLVAIVDWDANAFSIDCAGPGNFTPPACGNNWSHVDCQDASTDAGGGAGGSSGAGGIGGADAGSG